jgi:Uma2 family endonuclease
VRASHSRRLLDERLPKRWKRNQACPAIPDLVIEIIYPEQAMKEIEEAE